MKKHKILDKKRLMKNTTSMISILVVALLVFSSAVSAIDTSSGQEEMNINVIEMEQELPVVEAETSTGRAPQNLNAISTVVPRATINIEEDGNNFVPTSRGVDMYTQGYNGPSGNGWYYFDVEDPGTLNFIAATDGGLYNGGTWTCDQKWLVAEHYNGDIYEIDPDTGDMTTIGGGGTGLNALSFNPATNLLYGASSTGSIGGLWLIDPETGGQEYIGDFVNTVWVIGMAFNSEGTLYAWDISPDMLYEINTETGYATVIGSLGINLNYAQDGHFDMNEDPNILYLTAYTLGTPYGGGLYTCDVATGECTYVDPLQNTAECMGSMIKYTCVPPEHDVGIKSIDLPEDGMAGIDMPMQVTVKNYGNHSETTDVQFEILKCEAGPPLLSENFSTWPPAGWTNTGWYQSSTNYAGGISPEAKYTYPPYISYGEITTPPVNASGFEKVNIKFHLMAEFSTSYSPYLYLEYRKNASSPWRDVSPWDNPISGDLEPQYVEIGCYGWGENIGSEFQARLRFGSLYYYLLYNSGIYLDDFVIEGCAGCAEYAELVEDVVVPWDEEVVVEFPSWTPSEWGNASHQNTYEEYPMKAYTLLPDNNGQNDKKQQLLTLYFPWMHDIGTMAIDGPESGPAQTFDMDATIQNVGQNQECCFKVHAEVAELDLENSVELLTESFDTYLWPAGWTHTHPGNWYMSYSSMAGGSPYEARFNWYPSQTTTFRYYTPAIDTTDYGALLIEFKHYVNHFSGPYTLKVETSPDGVSWSTVWDKENPSSGQEDVSFTTGDNVGSSTLYVSWTFEGNSYNINYWYIDDIVIEGFGVTEPEYEDEMCIDYIDPGEEVLLEFDDWTPAFLAEETSGTKTYNIKVWTGLLEPEDNNHANDQLQISAILEYFHDVGVKEITSPADSAIRDVDWIQYSDETIDNALGLTSAPNVITEAIKLTPDELGTYTDHAITQIRVCKGYPGYNYEHDYEVWMYTGAQPTDPDDGTIVATGTSPQASGWFEIDTDDYAFAPTDTVWIGVNWEHFAVSTFPISLDSSIFISGKSSWFNYNLGSSWAGWSEYSPYSMMLGAGVEKAAGAPPVTVYVAPGSQNINAIVENIGTFPELDLTCYAEICEYITNCTNGTLVYEDNISDIDIDVPLGGTETLNFDSYNFAIEGVYGLFLNLPDDDDDYPGNNNARLGIGVDDTPPDTDHAIVPATPDGDNGYYVSDITVTLDASDPTIGCETDGSGVKEMKYTINGDPGTIPGDHGTFVIHDDGNGILVEYWAIDQVGNAEAKNSFIVDMDQTVPDMEEVAWETYKEGGDWYCKFTCTATDDTASMDRVEMFINDGHHETVIGEGPTFEFVIEWSSGFKSVIFWFYHYDDAGNMIEDDLAGDIPESYANYQQSQSNLVTNPQTT